MYTAKEHDADKERILEALDALLELRKKYGDVVAIPEVVILHDITEYRLNDYTGIKQFKKTFDRQTAQFVLNYFNSVDYITPEIFENTVVCALQDYKTQK
jgi:hypothetical protein